MYDNPNIYTVIILILYNLYCNSLVIIIIRKDGVRIMSQSISIDNNKKQSLAYAKHRYITRLSFRVTKVTTFSILRYREMRYREFRKSQNPLIGGEGGRRHLRRAAEMRRGAATPDGDGEK